MAGWRVRHLGIGRHVEVGEKSSNRAFTITFKSALHFYPAGCCLIITCRTVAGRASVMCLSSGQWCLAHVWQIYGCLGCPKFGPTPARCVRCRTGHRPGIDWFIGDQIAMRNTAPGSKSALKVTRCPPIPIMTRKLQWIMWGPGRWHPSQAHCD